MTLRNVLLDYIVYSFPGGGNDDPLQYSCPENSHGQRSLAGYSPRVHKELDMTEQLSHTHTHTHNLCNKITHVKTFYILVNNIMERSVSKETSESAD